MAPKSERRGPLEHSKDPRGLRPRRWTQRARVGQVTTGHDLAAPQSARRRRRQGGKACLDPDDSGPWCSAMRSGPHHERLARDAGQPRELGPRKAGGPELGNQSVTVGHELLPLTLDGREPVRQGGESTPLIFDHRGLATGCGGLPDGSLTGAIRGLPHVRRLHPHRCRSAQGEALRDPRKTRVWAGLVESLLRWWERSLRSPLRAGSTSRRRRAGGPSSRGPRTPHAGPPRFPDRIGSGNAERGQGDGRTALPHSV